MTLRFLRGSKLLFVTSMLASALAALADMVSPQIVRVAVDHVLGSAPTETLPGFAVRLIGRAGGIAALREHIWILALTVVAVAVVKAAAQYGYEVSKTAASETLVKTMRDSLFSHIERLPYAWHMKNRTGDIIQRCTSDIDTLKNFLAEQMTNLIRIVILLALSVAFMLGMNPRLTLIAMLPVPVIIGYSLYFHKKIGEAFLACDENEGILSTLAQENLTGVRVVRAFGRERDERDRFEKQNRYYTGLWMKLARPLATFWSVGDVLSGLQILLTVVFGAVFCIRGSMGPGAYIAFLSYCAMMTWPVRMLGRMISEMSKAGVSLDRIRYIMESPEEETSVGLTPDLSGDIVFDRVSFSYDGGADVLHDMSFTVPAGSTLGILGGTGCCWTSCMSCRRGRGASASAGRTCAKSARTTCAGTSAWSCRSPSCFPARSPKTSASTIRSSASTASASPPARPAWTRPSWALPAATTPPWASAA